MRGLLYKLVIALLSTMSFTGCNKDEAPPVANAGNDRAILVSTGKTELMDLPVWLETVGQVHSRSVPTLAAEVEGRIIMVSADTGDDIVEGQLLAETDTSTLLLQRQSAKAGLERLEVHIANGERRVERFKKLSSKDLSSRIELDDAIEQLDAFRADHKASMAQLAIVEDSLKKSHIIAPVSGVIQRRFISRGDFVRRGQALFEITRPTQLQAWLPYPETVALRIKIGQPAKIYSPLTPGTSIQGTVTELQPSIGLGSRAVMAIIDLQQPGLLRPEATLSGKVLIETLKNVVMVPAISIVRRPRGDVVYVIHNDKAEARQVVTGRHDGALIEISKGLNVNETIATDGASFLTDGALVKVSL